MKGIAPSTNRLWLGVQLLLMAAVFAAGWLWPALSPWWLLNKKIGEALFAVSGLIALAGCLALRGSLSAFPQPRLRQLVTRGIYRYERHPMYAGLIVLGLGWVFWTGSIAALVPLAALWWFLRRKAALEDGLLAQIYPEHDRYAKQTPCLLLCASGRGWKR